MSRWYIPASWEWASTEAIAKIVGGGTPPTNDESNFSDTIGYPWLTPADLSGYKETYIKRGRRNITDKGLSCSGASLMPKGTILFTSRAPVGYCVIAENLITTNQGFKSLILHNDIFPEYIRHYLLASKEYAESFASGSTFKELSAARMKELEFPLPPLNEQRRIADRIDALQARSRRAREALAEAQTLLEQFRQSVLSAAFRGDLTAKWREEHPDAEPASELLKRIRTERRKRWEKAELAKYAAKGKTPPPGWQKKYPDPVQVNTADLPGLPPGWCWASLDEISPNVQYGTSEKTGDDGDIPVLRMGNIVNGQLFFDNLKYLPASMIPDELCLDDGDILFNRTNSIELVGKSAVFRGADKTTFASYLIRVSVISVPPELVSEYINSSFGRSWVLSVASQQVGQANVNGTKLKALAIPLPPEEEQKYIAHIFSKTRLYSDRIAQTAAMSLSQCASLDQSILAKAFRGELVPQDPDDEPASKLLERIRSTTNTQRVRKTDSPARGKRQRRQ